ncbi:MAG: hypothetical protein ACRD1H_06435, partial [Vicinamibacterales bacterium]
MIPSFDGALRRRASWTVLALACLAYLLLGIAEQGARGAAVSSPSEAPLPFERHRVFGLDLSAMSSLQAFEWLNAAGNPSLALIVVPIDGDVVTALGQEAERAAAVAAVETL